MNSKNYLIRYHVRSYLLTFKILNNPVFFFRLITFNLFRFLSVILVTIMGISVHAQDSTGIEITGNYVGLKLQDALDDIEKHHPIRFFYRKDWLFAGEINQQFIRQPVTNVLDALLKNSDLTYINYNDDKFIIGEKEKLDDMHSNEYFLARQSLQSSDIDMRFPMVTVGDSSAIGNSKGNLIRMKLIDKEEGHKLEGATVYFENLEISATSDNLGRIEILLPNGIYQMEVRRVGYEPFIRNLSVLSAGEVKIGMEQEILQLKEVVISGEGPDQRLMNPQTGIVTITPRQIKDIPVFLGEADVIKTILTIPGVTTIGEGAPGFFVRGGNIDQNLILQDAAIFSNSSHALGFFSLFNPDLISNVRLYKGNIPAQFGGRLSSVLDVQLKGNNYSNSTITGGIGTVMSKLAIEAPIIKEKVNLLAGGRWAYSDWILRVIKIPEIKESKVSFYDFNVKMSAKVSEKGSISAGYFQSFDRVNFQGKAGYEWTIRNLSFNWDQTIGRNVQSEFIFALGQSDNLNFDPSGLDLTKLSNGQQFYKIKENVLFPVKNHRFIGGGEWIYYQPQNEVLRTTGSQNEEISLAKDFGQELGFYLNDEWELNKKVSLSAGLRTSMFFTEERGTNTAEDQQYINLEPRISARYAIGETGSVKASYNRISQYIHLLSNTVGALPADQWVVSNSRILPSTSNNYSVGFFKNFDLNSWESSAEVFFRRITNIIEFKDFSDLILNPEIENEIVQGRGKAYGLEMFLKRHTGKIKGSLSYTFSRTFIKADISEGNIETSWFPATFDRPHNLNLVMDWSVNRKSRFALVFNFTSGRPITAPVSSYTIGDVVVPHYSERNAYRISNYHRLDLAYTYKRNAVKRKKYQDSITFSIYNIYSRRNAFSVFFRKDKQRPARAYRLSVLGSAFPSITYSFQIK